MMERKLRRIRQELPQGECIEILKRGKVCVWAVAGEDDYPYAVPINYIYFNGDVYVHCAQQGHKLDAIRRNPKCSICVIDKDDIVPEEFTTYFRSVIAFGETETVEDEKGKIEVLRLLSDKYAPGFDPTEEIDRLLKNVAIIRIHLSRITGKEAIELTRMRK